MAQKPSSSSSGPSPLPLSLQRMLKELPPPPSSPFKTFIHRVPPELRIGNEHHYTPTTVSIGPFHASTPSLDRAQQLKSRALNNFLNFNPSEREITLQSLYHFIQEKELEARGCYADSINLSSDDFVKMMLLDGCFILELLTEDYEIPVGTERELFLHRILQDLLLLENQIPFFVLEGLSQRKGVFLSDLANGNFRYYILKFFLPILPNCSFLSQDLVFSVTTPTHLLELVLFGVFPIRSPNAFPIRSPNAFRHHCFGKINLSELALYGITFSSNLADSITNISFFANGELKIHPLCINETSISLFKNLLAFEMCSSAQTQSCLVSYLFLMNSLVDTTKDVELLVSAGVLKTMLNDKQALVTLLTDLAADMVVNDDDMEYYKDVYTGLQKYCDSRLARWRAKFMRYCHDSRLGILNCIILFILIVTQTLFSIWTHNVCKN